MAQTFRSFLLTDCMRQAKLSQESGGVLLHSNPLQHTFGYTMVQGNVIVMCYSSPTRAVER